MDASATLTVPINSQLKSEAVAVLDHLGVSTSTAISMYLQSIVQYGHIPADVECANFNAETLAAMTEARDIASGTLPSKGYKTAEEMMDDIITGSHDELNLE